MCVNSESLKVTTTPSLTQDVSIIQAAVGAIEYKKEGESPYLLVSHGSPGGYNHSVNAVPFLEVGIRIIYRKH